MVLNVLRAKSDVHCIVTTRACGRAPSACTKESFGLVKDEDGIFRFSIGNNCLIFLPVSRPTIWRKVRLHAQPEAERRPRSKPITSVAIDFPVPGNPVKRVLIPVVER